MSIHYNSEKKIFDSFQDMIRLKTSIEVTNIKEREKAFSDSSFKFIDFVFDLEFKGNTYHFNAEVKRIVTPNRLGSYIELVYASEKEIGNCILVGEYISPGTAKMLKRAGINYADSIGNVFIAEKGLYIDIQSDDSAYKKIAKKQYSLSKKGLLVVEQLIIHPEKVTLNSNEFAENSDVSIGTAHNTFKFLLESSILGRSRTRYYILDSNELLNIYIDQSPDKDKANEFVVKHRTNFLKKSK